MNRSCHSRRQTYAAIITLLTFSLLSPVHAEEQTPGVDSYYHNITVSDDAELEAIITLPAGDSSPRHPLLFLQWVSCGSIEYRDDSNAHTLLGALAKDSGLALVRVERSAIRQGPACDALDFDTEFNHYRDAFVELLGSPQLDASKIYVYGSSLGAMVAPLIAMELQRRGHDIAGIVVQGGGAVTYYERMLAFERHYLERRPDDVRAANIQEELLRRAKFHYEYLVEQRHPDDIAKDSQDMALVRNDVLGLAEKDHYGRPFAWHQQIAQRNVLEAWRAVDTRVLVVFNGFDQFETRHGHQLIVATVNRHRPGTAQFVERPHIGHSDNRYATIEEAYAFDNGERAWQGAAQIMLEWFAKL